MQRLMGILVMVFVLGFSVSGKAEGKDTLTIGVAAEFENLHPIIGQQAVTKYIIYTGWRPLVVLSLDGKWSPLLIKEIPTIENKMAKKKGEGLEVTFDILDNLKWGDGVPVTCKDVAFGWEVGKNKNVSNPNREPYENITSVVADKANPKKCTINFAKAKYDYFANLPEALPSHLDEEIFNKHKNKAEGYDVNSLYTKNPTNPGLWMGPYILSELKLGSHLVFVPNPHWEGKRPGFKKIIYKLIPNNATFEANLRSGTIDMVSPSAGLSSDQAAALEKKTKAENLPFNVVFQDGYVYGHVDVNLDNPVLSDLKVRKALSMAFNKKDMIDSLLEGKARPANHFVTEKDPWYTDKVEIYNYNKREAMRTLDEAGWKMTPSGIREKNGKRLTFTIYSSAGAKINDMIMAYLQDKWRAIGADLQIKTEAARVFFGQTVSHRKYDLALYSWISIPESSPRSILHSSMIPSEKNAWAGQNSGGWRNKEVDKLVDQLEMELNAKKRADIAHKVIELYTKEIPVIPLYYRGNNAVIPKWLKGYQLSGHLYYETLYAENWTN